MNISTFNEEKSLKPSFLFRLTTSFVFSLAFAAITLLIHANPSGAEPGTPFPGNGAAVIVTLISFIFLWGFYFSILIINRKNIFLIHYFASFAAVAAVTIWLGLSFHRDYFTHIFQVILIYWLLFIFRNDLFASLHSKRQFYTFLFIFNTVIFGTALLWIILMGYAIATRQEPRWAESLVYNAYNTVLIFFLGVTSLRLQLQRFRNIRIIGGDLYIDDWDFSRYFSDLDTNIIREFLSAEGNLTCFMLEKTLRTDSNGNTGGEQKPVTWDCKACIADGHTTTKCPKYKNIYNRILNIKKLFETLDIGTIITPENKMQIKKEGWKMRLFDDVRVIRHHK